MFSQNALAKDLRILIVEDQYFMAGLVSQILCGLGAEEVDLVPNGVEAVRKLNTDVYDLAICDIAMEPFNGLQLLAAIRAGITEASRELPVIMLTGHSDEKMKAVARGLAANSFLPKPVSWNSLSAELARLLDDPNPFPIPELNPEKIRRELSAAQNRSADLEEDLRFVGHIYRKPVARGRKDKEPKLPPSTPRADGAARVRPVENLAAGDGRKLLSKGLQLSNAKVKLLCEQGRAFGITQVKIREAG